MRIAINGLSARFGGGAAYLENLLGHLSKIDRENEYIVFACPERRGKLASQALKKLDQNNSDLAFPYSPKANSSYWGMRGRPPPQPNTRIVNPNFSIIAPGFPGKAVIRRTVWEQLFLPGFIRRHGVDVLFSPGGIAPLMLTSRCRRVNMVQNIAPFSDELLASYPPGRRKLRFLILRKLYPLFAARADANIFISMDGFAKLQRIAELNIEKKVIYHGRNELFKPVPPDVAANFIHAQYGISGRFILYVSNIARYKKQLEVVRAYHIVRERGADVSKLVLAGMMVESSYYREVLAIADRLGVGDEVAYLGQVPQDHLPHLYSAASVFVFASICEGCPNILIEAMACGAPIVSSKLGPMPEICGNAALYFDPYKPTDIADRMWQVLTDEAIRQELVRNALENVKSFSWEETAQKTLEVLTETMI